MRTIDNLKIGSGFGTTTSKLNATLTLCFQIY